MTQFTPSLSPIEVYELLLKHYGKQEWWPADSTFEMMVGAILTQNTSWRNVEKAIANLKAADMLDCETIAGSDLTQLAECIRPSGSYLQKARYLQQFARFYCQHEQRRGLARWPTSSLRVRLLDLYGIGPETADSMLLYGLERCIFVVDAYTKRLFSRLGHFAPELKYENVQQYFTQRLPESLPLYQEFHALIVEQAKHYCKTKPDCDPCPLRDHCPTAAPAGAINSSDEPLD